MSSAVKPQTSQPPPEKRSKKMTVDEFMKWYETAEGRWELHDGVPVRKHDPAKGQSERIQHLRLKSEIFTRVKTAIARAGKDCEALPDGASVKISEEITYEPDALVYCGERLEKGAIIVPEPVIIVEVLSPSTAWKDLSDKLEDYFTLPSVAHYLVLDPGKDRLLHYRRNGEQISVKIVHDDRLALDPPGIELDLEELFGGSSR